MARFIIQYTCSHAFDSLGNILCDRHEYPDAETFFRTAIALRPDADDFHCNLAHLLLLTGRYEEGWREYQRRLEMSDPLRAAMWDGLPLAGKTILVYPEQGIGDAVQCMRYLPMLKAQGARCCSTAQGRWRRRFSRWRGIDRVIRHGEECPPYDVHAPLFSLPRLCGTTLETIPPLGPLTDCHEEWVASWRQWTYGLDGFKVGIMWQGSPEYVHDRRRSVPLSLFATLAAVPGVRLIGLQKGPVACQTADFDLVRPLLDEGDVFMDTAALIQSLDLVVTVDTAVGHLAGSLGVPTWIALSYSACWRWLTDRDDSPWYPSVRLFRQERLGEWGDVFARMGRELGKDRSWSVSIPPSWSCPSSFVSACWTPRPSCAAVPPPGTRTPRRSCARWTRAMPRSRRMRLALNNANAAKLGMTMDQVRDLAALLQNRQLWTWLCYRVNLHALHDRAPTHEE